MQDQCARIRFQQEIFRAPARATNGAAGDAARKSRIDGPAQAAIVNDQPINASSDDVRLDSATGCFYFGEFWHGLAFDRGDSSLVFHYPTKGLQPFAHVERHNKYERLWVAAGPSCKRTRCKARNPRAEHYSAATPRSDLLKPAALQQPSVPAIVALFSWSESTKKKAPPGD